MKKTILLMGVALFFTGVVPAQDNTSNSTKQTHKKAMHNSRSTSVDNAGVGQMTTNPNGKMGSKSSGTKRKTPKRTPNSSMTNSADSAK